jgi:protein-tyrosine phosphatase
MPPYRMCFVCMGNICRSPMAAAVMQSMLIDAGLADRVVVDSAGTGGWHVGGSADERALETLRAHGYDGDDHRARQIDAGWFADHDLILAMDGENMRALQRMAPPGQAGKLAMFRAFDPASSPNDLDVPDPYYGGAAGFDHVFSLVEAACQGLIDHLQAQLE